MRFKRSVPIAVAGLFALSFLARGILVFALPPLDVSAKICSASTDGSLKVGCDVYSSAYNICDAQCMKQRVQGSAMGANFFNAYSSPAAQSANSSDLQATAKYFPQVNSNASTSK